MRAGVADDLSAEGSGLRARQTKRSPHAPDENPPTLNHGDDVYYYVIMVSPHFLFFLVFLTEES